MTKNVHAVILGRLGGLKGGPSRATELTAERRSEIARNAALARWHKQAPEKKVPEKDLERFLVAVERNLKKSEKKERDT